MKGAYNDLLRSLASSERHDEWRETAHSTIDAIEEVIENCVAELKALEIPRLSPSAEIHPTAIIGPNVIIAKDVVIGPCCYIRDFVILDERVYLGYNVEISNAILLNGVSVHHTSCLGNSIVGQESNIGAFFAASTRKLGKASVGDIRFGDGTLALVSERRHHGAAIGKSVECGVSVCTMPGATVGHSSVVYPNSVIQGELAPRSRGYYAPGWMKALPE